QPAPPPLHPRRAAHRPQIGARARLRRRLRPRHQAVAGGLVHRRHAHQAEEGHAVVLAGHFAAAAAMKAKEPRAPTWALVVGVQVLDILFALFVALGLERFTKTPGRAAGLCLDFIDWSHSLVMTLLWSALFAALVYLVSR